jgi:hypothetical protein
VNIGVLRCGKSSVVTILCSHEIVRVGFVLAGTWRL